MLIIGKRGAAGLAAENSMAALTAGRQAGCDILHIDVRLTRDGTPVLHHDTSLRRTHGVDRLVSQLSAEELASLTSDNPIATLDAVLDKFYGKIILLIELRGRGTAKTVSELLNRRAQQSQSEWDNLILASYRISDLLTVRKLSRQAPLALLHDNNPFTYIAYHRLLNFTAVGFHRLHTNRLAHQIATKAKIFTFAYTVNRPQAARLLDESGYDGVVTNYPDRLVAELGSTND